MRWAIVVVLLGALAAAQQAAEVREGDSDGVRAGITVPAGTDPRNIADDWREELERFEQVRKKYLLY